MSELKFSTLEMPGAQMGPMNPLPALRPPGSGFRRTVDDSVPEEYSKYMNWGMDFGPLPYRLQDDYDRSREPRRFKTAILENDKLIATFIPEFGGRLWSLFHKPTNRELLYVNPVFQPGNLALRRAWISGGVEWNMGVRGHTPMTLSPLFVATTKLDSGEPVLRMYEWERIRQAPYQMDFYLPEGSDFLMVRVRIVNPNDHMIPMYWWSNLACDETDDTRIIAPANCCFAYHYSGRGVAMRDLPVDHDEDLTRPRGRIGSKDVFYRIDDGARPWISAVTSDGIGLVQLSTSLLKGRKLYAWGDAPGGRNWMEFLSEPGLPYIELQAGLARTQMEHLPMDGGAVWQWLEAYGPMQADGKLTHGDDWAAARGAIQEKLDAALPPGELESQLSETQQMSDRAPDQIVTCGSGWGALERIRTERAGTAWPVSDSMPFTDDSLTDDQQPWLALLETGKLPETPADQPPGAFMVQGEWRDLLRESVAAGGDHWLARYHLGIMDYEAGDVDSAIKHWQTSMDQNPSVWVLRNLATAASHVNDTGKAAELFNQARQYQPNLKPLILECCRAMLMAEQYQQVIDLLAELPGDIADNGRIQATHAIASLRLGDLETTERILTSGIVVTDIREGETSLAEIWFELKCRQVAKSEGVEIDGVEVVAGDLADESLAPRLVEDMDAVIHLANVKENRELFLDTNIKGTFYLLDACKKCGHIQQYVQAGSDARAGIYYYPQPLPIDENHPHRGYPGYYPLSKVLEEVMCEQFRMMYGLAITVLRFSWVQDEDDFLAHITLKEPNFGVPVWKDWATSPEQQSYFDNGLDGVAMLVHPGGEPGRRQIVGIKDVVQSIMLSLGNPKAVGEAFNVSGPAPFSYDAAAGYVSEKMNLPIVKFEVGEFNDFSIDMTKSRTVLGFNPEYDIFRIVDDAVAFRNAGKKRSACLYPG